MELSAYKELLEKSRIYTSKKAMKEITLSAFNRTEDNLDTASTKKNLSVMIRFSDSSFTKPLKIADALSPRRSVEVKMTVPDAEPIDTYFMWEEGTGAQTVHKGAIFFRDSKFIGTPWNDALIFWDIFSMDGVSYEYAGGGINYRSG